MKYLVGLQRFFESGTVRLEEFDKFILNCSLGFMTLPQDDMDKTLPQFRPGGSANASSIETIQTVLKGHSITEEEISQINPVLNHVLYLYDKQKKDPTKSLQLKVYADTCQKKYGYKSTFKPDISNEENYPKRKPTNTTQEIRNIFRTKRMRYLKDLFNRLKGMV